MTVRDGEKMGEFWADLRDDMTSPEFRRSYADEAARIAAGEEGVAVSEQVYGVEPAADQGWIRVALQCVDEEAAAAAAAFVFERGVPWSKQSGSVMETVAGSPSVVMRLADDALEHRWADDPEAAAIIAAMSDEVDRRRA